MLTFKANGRCSLNERESVLSPVVRAGPQTIWSTHSGFRAQASTPLDETRVMVHMRPSLVRKTGRDTGGRAHLSAILAQVSTSSFGHNSSSSLLREASTREQPAA